MPADSPLNGTPPAAADDQTGVTRDAERTPGSGDADLAPVGEQVAGEQYTSDSGRVPSVAERLVEERAERRRQRMLARESSTATPKRDRAERRSGAAGSSSALAPPGRQALRGSLFRAMIVVLAAGAVLGAILGALSVAGWVIGLLVAGLTGIALTVLRPRARSA